MSRLLTGDEIVRWKVTHWRLSTHSAHRLTQLDIERAHRIAAAAKDQGAVKEDS